MSRFSLHDESVRNAYLKLVRQFPLVSIENDKELSAAQEMLDWLLRRGKLDEGAEAYLNALSDLIVLYESEHVVIEHPGDAELLQHLIEARGITQTTLAAETGIGKSTISEILSGKRLGATGFASAA